MTRFTPEDLLLYLYRETSPETTALIEKALQEDWTLREKLAVLKDAQQRLDKTVESPRTEIILNILNYARNTEPASVQS
ncbi:MAG TPA: hypothetical protein VIK74_02455 [Parasegetibacter sp.]